MNANPCPNCTELIPPSTIECPKCSPSNSSNSASTPSPNLNQNPEFASHESRTFFYAAKGQKEGPVNFIAIKQAIVDGSIHWNTEVWWLGMADWAPAGSTSLYVLFTAPPPPPPEALLTPSGPPPLRAATFSTPSKPVPPPNQSYALLRDFFTFQGRINRGSFIFRNFLAAIIPGALFSLLETLQLNKEIATTFFLLFWFYLGLTASVKRLHDLNRSAWYAILLIVPVFGLFLVIFPGTKGPNSYGDPK